METTTVRERLTVDTCALSGVASRPVSICLLGQPYWASKLEECLNQSGGSRLSAFRLPLNSRRFFRNFQKALSADLIVRMGFRPGARTVRGYAFDTLWATLRLLNRRAAGVFYWLGTDVLNTTEDLRAGKLRHRCYAQAKKDYHLADAPWLAEELRNLGITALPKTVTLPRMVEGAAPELPAEFSVLTYIPDGRYRFYGGDCIYQAARRLPGIRFDVVGGVGAWIPEPLPNLKFHGWQRDIERFYRNTTVVMRLVEHDGTGLTAVEGLSFGRHVLYSFPLPHTLAVAWGDTDALVTKLSGMFHLHQRGSLRVNAAGRAYAEEHFDHDRRMEDLISHFLEIAPQCRNGRPERNGG